MSKRKLKKNFKDSTSISCEFCDQTFSKLHDYNEHIQQLHIETVGEVCEHCNECFKTQNVLRNHIKNCHKIEEKQFLCGFDDCSKAFARKYGLERHLLTHSNEFKQIQCPICHRLFVEKIQLERHYQVHLKEEKITDHQCSKCLKYFNRKADLIRHEKTVHQEKLHECDQCSDRRFGSKFAVLRHFKTVHLGMKSKRRKPAAKVLLHDIFGLSAKEENYDEIFLVEKDHESNIEMIEILEKVEAISQDSFEVELPEVIEDSCDSISTQNYFKIPTVPQKIQTKTITKWECQRCNRTFEDVQRLKLHNARNHNWICKKCPGGKFAVNTFHRREDFELHWLENHGDETFPDKLECSVCFDMFADKAALHTHQKNDHAMQLASRIRKSDENDNRSICSYCQEEFKSPTSLKKHLLQVHKNGDLKMRKCFSCNLQIQTFKEFEIHIEQHKFEHVCLICGGKPFHDAKSLKTHQLKAHYRCSDVKL